MYRTILATITCTILLACSLAAVAKTDAGPRIDQAVLEKSVQFSSRLESKWRVRDVVTATINNPLPTRLKGEVTLTVSGRKRPIVKRFDIAPAKQEKLDFQVGIVWDGRTPAAVDATVRFDGIDTHVVRTIDVATNQRIYAVPACPLDRVMEIRIVNPMKTKINGKVRLFDVKGLKLLKDHTDFAVENQCVVGLTLTEAAPKEFSFGCELDDIGGKAIFRSPALDYKVLEDFSSTAFDQPITEYSVATDGNADASGRASLDAARRDSHYTAVPPLHTGRFKYESTAGSQIFRIVPKSDIELPANAVLLGMWIDSDANPGSSARCRLVDSTGQAFEPTGFNIDWLGWRYRTIPVDGAGTAEGSSGHKPPYKLDAIFLLDTQGKQTRGTLYFGPIMLVSKSAEIKSK